MQLTITGLDYAPNDLYGQAPLVVDIIRKIPGPDRPDYWLGASFKPITWLVDNRPHEITHLILADRWREYHIGPGMSRVPVGIAFVIDLTLLDDAELSFKKCKYVAIGMAHDTTDGKAPAKTNEGLAGHIAPAFGGGRS